MIDRILIRPVVASDMAAAGAAGLVVAAWLACWEH